MSVPLTGGAHLCWLAVRLSAALLVLWACIAVGPSAQAQAPSPAQPGFSLEWRRSVPPLRDLAISPQGTRLALLTADGKLAVWDALKPAPLWSKENVNGTDVLITDGVGYAVLFDPMNPVDASVQLYNAISGHLIASLHPDGAVWDVDVSQTGDYLSFGTGSGSLYICALDVAPLIHRVALRGVCNAVAMSPDGTFVATGLWNQSGVDWMDLTGKPISSQNGDPTQRFEPAISGDSRYILGLQYENHQHRNPVLTLWKRDGSRQWTYAIGRDVSDARALVSKHAEFVVASYFKQIERDHTMIPERRLLMLDAQGKPVFQFGGLYLSLTLMFLSPDNDGFVAYDGDRALYRFDRAGNVIRKWPLTSPIRAWSVTADDEHLLVHTTDNVLAYIRIR